MKDVMGFIKTTLIGGAFIILPLALIAILLQQAINVAHKALKPIASQFSDSLLFPYVIAAALVIVVCFAAGLTLKTAIGRRFGGFLERRLYERLPGYKLMKAVAGGSFGEQKRQVQPAFVEMNEGLVPALIMERHGDGRATVFVPVCPTPTVGLLYIFPDSKLHPVDVSIPKFAGCFSAWGLELKDLLPPMRST